MQTLEGLKRRIKTTTSLKDIVSSMKTLSAVSVGQYEKSTKALKQYADSIELALLALLRGRNIPKNVKQQYKEQIIAIIFGSDQGLVGRFNKSIASFAISSLQQNNIDLNDVTFIVGGKSLSSKILSMGYDIDTLFTMPSSVKAMITVAKKIVFKLSEIQSLQQNGDKDFSFSNRQLKIYLFYNSKDEHSVIKQNMLQILPVDENFLKKLSQRKWPTKNIPIYAPRSRRTLFSLFMRQLLFVNIYKAIAQSLASEHFTRMISMQNAEKNIDEHLEQMNLEYQQRRQTEITNELLDVVIGAEVLNSKKK
ncbi:MAG: F0F1 ATP synthase subunit gamma [Alphaproteobacteria bacterium]|nr:F0F1 ATP synthase subunit gamma [Alphaproteobacteria bacterium]